MKALLRRAAGILLVVHGSIALVCGLLLAAAPDGHLLQMTPALLAGSPFGSFLVPGLVLATVLGLGGMAAGLLALRGHPLHAWAVCLAGGAILGWIGVQMTIIPDTHTQQYIIGSVGVAALAMGLYLLLQPQKDIHHS